MDENDLARLERRMEDRWNEFVHATWPTSVLQVSRLYDRYLDALDAYMRAKQQMSNERATVQNL